MEEGKDREWVSSVTKTHIYDFILATILKHSLTIRKPNSRARKETLLPILFQIFDDMPAEEQVFNEKYNVTQSNTSEHSPPKITKKNACKPDPFKDLDNHPLQSLQGISNCNWNLNP